MTESRPPAASSDCTVCASSESPAGIVGIVIPALNEVGNIGTVVEEIRSLGFDLVVVADNGSTDATAAEARDAGAIVVSEPRRGYGYACAAASHRALDEGADIVVTIDGDQSSRPVEIESLVAPIRSGAASLVLGSRALGTIEEGAMGPHQRFGNWMMAAVMRRLYDVEVTDLGPFRAITADLFRSLDMQEMTFGWPTEMMVKTARSGEKIMEVPVSWDRRTTGESKVSGTVKGSALAAYHIMRVTFRYSGKRASRHLAGR